MPSAAGPEIMPQAVHPAEAEKVAAAQAPSPVMAPPEPIPTTLPLPELPAMEMPEPPPHLAPPAPSPDVMIPVSPPSIHERLAAQQAESAGVASEPATPPVAMPVSESTLPAAPVAPPTPATAPESVGPEDDFEAIMNTVMQDLDGDALPENAPGAEELLSLDSVASLSDLCDRSRAESTTDFLLLAAYYMTHYDQQKNFSLKQLNSALVRAGLSPVNHSALESALQQGVLTMVPDLTGTAEVSEYRLSELGTSTAEGLL
jgi:hypothetical protein